MKHLLPPEAWRSEAFAEDLFADPARRAPSPGVQRGRVLSTLLGVLPVLLAGAGAVCASLLQLT